MVASLALLVLHALTTATAFLHAPLHQKAPAHARRRSTLLRAAPADEAVAIFLKQYRSSQSKPGSLFAVPEDKLRATFKALADVYGEAAALEMTKRTPASLAFDPKNFAPTFAIWKETFGDEETRGMVLRNPALLGVPPSGYNAADSAGNETMVLSYVVAFTRPAGPVLLALLFVCLATPFVEGLSGTPIRAQLLAGLAGALGGAAP